MRLPFSDQGRSVSRYSITRDGPPRRRERLLRWLLPSGLAFWLLVAPLSVGGQTPELISVNSNGTGSGGFDSFVRGVSADGRYVLFVSFADDLVPNDHNGAADIFVRDRVVGRTILVSVNQDGTASGNGASFGSAVITPDGRFVAFASDASNLVGNDTNGATDVFVRDLVAGITTLVSVNRSGFSGNGPSSGPLSVSSNGQRVAFGSLATDLVALADNNTAQDIFVRDLSKNTTQLISVNSARTAAANAASTNPVISASGRRILFASAATDLTSLPTPSGGGDVYLYDLQTGVTALVSVNAAGTAAGNGVSGYSGIFPNQMSGDGSRVVFESNASDLVANDINGVTDVFVRDVAAGTTTLVSVNAAGTASGNNISPGALISNDGALVVFASSASDLVANDTNGFTQDVFRRNLTAATTTLISRNAAGTGSGNGSSFSQAISADANTVAFSSSSTDLVATPDNNGTDDVFVRRLGAGMTLLASVNATGTATGNGASINHSLSADGSVVAFESQASDLVPNDTNGSTSDVFAFVVVPPTTGSLAGFVFNDRNNDGARQPAELGIGGATINLSGTTSLGAAVAQSTSSAADGSYAFTALAPGTYSLLETQPAGFLDGQDSVGTAGGVLGNDMVSGIVLVAGTRGQGYNFGEHAEASVSIGDAAVSEGQAAQFTVTLSTAITADVVVQFATANGTATAGLDYTATRGSLTIPAGQTSAIISVPTLNDTLSEPAETFFVNLISVTNADLADAQGQGTINDTDFSLSVTPGQASVREGTAATFTVTVQAARGSFDVPVVLSCPDLTPRLACAFTPAMLTPGSSSATATLTIDTSRVAELQPPGVPERPAPVEVFAAASILLGFALVRRRSGRKRKRALALALFAVLLLCVAGCSSNGRGPVEFDVVVAGTAGGVSHTTIVPLTVQR